MKKKITVVALVICLLAIAIVGGTMAYFTDSEVATNTFTAGSLGLTLDEAVVVKDKDGNLVATGERTKGGQKYHLYPAQTVAKDPTITLDKGSEDAYVGAIVTITGDLYGLIGIKDYDTINIHALASGGLMADQEGAAYGDYNDLFVFQNKRYAIHQVADKTKNTWTLYIFVKDIQHAGDKTVLFEKLNIPKEYDNEQMKKLNGMSINVAAYAAQANGFDDCYKAMTTAFPGAFDF